MTVARTSRAWTWRKEGWARRRRPWRWRCGTQSTTTWHSWTRWLGASRRSPSPQNSSRPVISFWQCSMFAVSWQWHGHATHAFVSVMCSSQFQ
jgi:hypothetical protein